MRKIIIRRDDKSNDINLGEGIHPILQRIYSARGITQPDELAHGLENLLPYSELMDIDKAVDCLYNAIKDNKRIMIVGDFDADGATSSCVAMTALKRFGAQHVNYIVPNRFEYGYGLTPEIIKEAESWQPDLLVTVDNGISSIDGVAYAKSKAMQVVITDHHLQGAELPDADAIVNPNRHGDPFLSKNLAGVGVIFYVMLALRAKLRDVDWFVSQAIPEPNMAELLDLVALGTVADVVPLDSNNRILVQQGLRRIRAGKCRPGIVALLEIGKRKLSSVVAADLAFAVAPRLNAAGRLDDMSHGIECLLSTDDKQARMLASELDSLNTERKSIETDMQKQALKAIDAVHVDATTVPMGLCLFEENWHQGVIGIVAARIKERVHRPVIAFANADDGFIKGSARSIPGLHIRDVLDEVATREPGLIDKFGGHAMAAGLTLLKANLPTFKQRFAEVVGEHVTDDILASTVYSDGELSKKEFNAAFADMLRDAGPWGQAFPEPMFDGLFTVVQQRLVGAKHLKLTLKKEDRVLDAIAFNVDLNLWPNHRAQRINAAYKLDVNEYRGQRSVQLILDYFEEA
ncbi:MAG: single-stranded-DNA-specific exonuclease RecJ [Legionellales bacterium]|nr:single-stranded-DNA-specific exonuclease RecJ [Legionellales bacterium]|tara:strand:+ start:16878 stop:18602 length:1725 start_codon:yes stop_codon:yes gene_type:complete